jgi:hypothetical protein
METDQVEGEADLNTPLLELDPELFAFEVPGAVPVDPLPVPLITGRDIVPRTVLVETSKNRTSEKALKLASLPASCLS